MNHQGIFLTWERHQRTRNLATQLNLKLREALASGPRYQRYWSQIVTTLSYLRREQSTLVFVQCPSIVLMTLVLLWRLTSRSRCTIVMDAHNEIIDPTIVPWLRPIYAWAVRHADFTIVTNRFLTMRVTEMGGRPLVLPDPLPDVEASPAPELTSVMRLLVIATYAVDEPIRQIIDAAWNYLGRVEFHFTGNYQKLSGDIIAGAPPNVKFLGFVPEVQYWEEMRDCHAVIDMTTMEDCLVCGAYEAVAIGRPMLLSSTRALRDHFRNAAIYAAPSLDGIIAGVRRLRANYAQLCEQVQTVQAELRAEWSAKAAGVMARVTTPRTITLQAETVRG